MNPQKRYPFKFLDAYVRDDRDIFFGRDEEVDTLYQMVFQTDLMLLYGPTGTGKTSLIQCGLAGKFQPYEWLALSIRRGDDLNESLEKALSDSDASADAPAGSLDWLDDSEPGAAKGPASPVALRLKNLYLRHFKPIFLIFDQFEELYILGSKAEQNRFVDTVREILLIEQPVKIIFSIREEYLGYLYEFERKVPELLRKKLRIEPMNLEKVQAVVQGIGRLPESNVRLRPGEEKAIGQGIFEKLKGRENSRTIELPYLQVFLDKLYLKTTGDPDRQSDAEFTLDGVNGMGELGDVLRNFLDEQVQQNARELDISTEAVKKLLAPFVTLDGTKAPLSPELLHARLPEWPKAFIARSLEAFQKSRILRFDEKEQRYEVAHDSLARQIATYQDAEDVALQKAAQMIRTQMLLDADRREVFSEKQLLFIEPYLPKLDLGAEETTWIAQSRAHWTAEIDARARREREELDRTRQRLRIVRGLLFAAVLAVMAAGYFAYIALLSARKEAESAQIAVKKSEEAEMRRVEADTAKAQAIRQQKIAENNDSLARKEAENARNALQRQLAAEQAAKRQQMQTELAQARDFRGREQYNDAIDAYRNALALAPDPLSRQQIAAGIRECETEKRENDFQVARERGLRLVAVNECKAARPYLQAALAIRPDKAVQDALKKCP